MKKFTVDVPIFEVKVKFNVDVVDNEVLWDNLWMTDQRISWSSDIYLENKNDLNTVVHEIYHAVQNIIKTRWIEDEETWAYLMWYIITKYKLKLDKILNNKTNTNSPKRKIINKK